MEEISRNMGRKSLSQKKKKEGIKHILLTRFSLISRFSSPVHFTSPTQIGASTMSSALTNGPPLLSLPSMPISSEQQSSSTIFSCRLYSRNAKKIDLQRRIFKHSTRRIKGSQSDGAGSYESLSSDDTTSEQDKVAFDVTELRPSTSGSSFLAKLAIILGIAATITMLSIVIRQPGQSSSIGTQLLVERSASSTLAAPAGGFSFNAFGYRLVIPEYAPGWVYFWLLMAAGCGLFISEEALNIWVGISLSRLLTLDRTWQSFASSFSRNSPYIISTVLWVYWGVCISDMIPFYLGKLFKRSGASEDVYSKLGIGKEKVMNIKSAVQKYGNLIGFVERFSLGVRNPTAFLAGAVDISPDCFFAGVCCGGLITLPLQLGIGFLMRERPVFALATVATVVGVWTIFPYAAATLTAVFFYIRNRYSR